MKVRNLPYNKLSEKEKRVIKAHYEYCMKNGDMMCNMLHKGVDDFWEEHRVVDTDFGRYKGWVEPQEELEDIVEKKLGRIRKKPKVPCKKCKKLFVRNTRWTKLCNECWDEAQGKRTKKWHKGKNIVKTAGK